MSLYLDIIQADSTREIYDRLVPALEKFSGIFPESKDAKILLKPNLNSNMNALTGNTTDLRLLAAVIRFLKSKGYRNITVGEGTNSGFYRNNISVISRLAVDCLADHFGVNVIDFNASEKVEIPFEDGVIASAARECLEADFLINMPKLKTHFEVGMSVCLKSLMGCLVGQENKKKTHKSLAANILNINKKIKPDLQIVDGLIAMEGLGPSRGTPVKTGVIMLGTDPYLLDLACCQLARFDYSQVKTLSLARERGLISQEYHDYIASLDFSGISRRFLKPETNPLVSFIHSPKRQKYFLAIRNTAFFNYVCSTKLVGKLLFLSGLRQDNFIDDEMDFKGFTVDRSRCPKGCAKCADYCPVSLKLPEELERADNQCIGCLYCFMVCPEKTIEFKGELGFMAEQLRQYDECTRKVV